MMTTTRELEIASRQDTYRKAFTKALQITDGIPGPGELHATALGILWFEARAEDAHMNAVAHQRRAYQRAYDLLVERGAFVNNDDPAEDIEIMAMDLLRGEAALDEQDRRWARLTPCTCENTSHLYSHEPACERGMQLRSWFGSGGL